MLLAVLLVLGPVALYLILAALPPALARRGLWSAGVLLALLWLAWPLGWPPFGAGALEDAVVGLALAIWTVALAAAALLQRLRPGLAARGRLVYPLAVLGALALVLAVVAPAVGLL